MTIRKEVEKRTSEDKIARLRSVIRIFVSSMTEPYVGWHIPQKNVRRVIIEKSVLGHIFLEPV